MKREYLGKWCIVEMEQWDQDYIDLVVPGYDLFEENNLDEFQFGTYTFFSKRKLSYY